MSVLVVDDNILDRKYIKYLIEVNLGFETQTAKGGIDALNKLCHRPFDLVVTDLIMPNMEGVELIQRISSFYPNSKIIAISGGNPYYLYVIKKLGVEFVFTKPIDTLKFLNAIQNLLPASTHKLAV